MSDVNFRVHWNFTEPPEGTTLTEGEQWKIYLNQEFFTEDVSKFIVAEYVRELNSSEYSSCKDTIRVFELKIARVNIPDLKPTISPCDIADAGLYSDLDIVRDELEFLRGEGLVSNALASKIDELNASVVTSNELRNGDRGFFVVAANPSDPAPTNVRFLSFNGSFITQNNLLLTSTNA